MMFDSVDLSLSKGYIANLRALVRKIRGVGKWRCCVARVTSCERVVESSPDGETMHYEVRFTYSVEGISYAGKFALPGYGTDRLFAKDDEVTIQVNPSNPEEAVYSDAWADGELFWIWSFVACFLFLAHWLITGHLWSASSPSD